MVLLRHELRKELYEAAVNWDMRLMKTGLRYFPDYVTDAFKSDGALNAHRQHERCPSLRASGVLDSLC